MSEGITYLHSHSALERDLRYPKHIVLVDERFEETLLSKELKKSIKFKRYKNDGVTYIEVPMMIFLKNGGVFKNLSK